MSQEQPRSRWVPFLLILTAGYFLVVTNYQRKQQEYQAQKKKLEAAALVEAAVPGATTATLAQLPLSSGAPPSLSAGTSGGVETAPPVPTMDVVTAPQTVVETKSVRVTFSNFGAKPLKWELLPARFVVNKDEEGKETGKPYELIPQEGDYTKRQWPLEFVGSRIDAFNLVPYESKTEQGPKGDTIVTFTSQQAVYGMTIEKRFTFPPEGYDVAYSFRVQNGPDAGVRISGSETLGTGWLGGFGTPHAADRAHGTEQALVALEDDLRTKTVKADSEPVEYSANVAWAGLERKFFTALVVPGRDNLAKLAIVETRNRNDAPIYNQRGMAPPHNVALLSENKTLQPNEAVEFHYTVYAGPTSFRMLNAVSAPMRAEGMPLSSAVFHSIPLGMSWIRPICVLMLDLLIWLDGAVKSWGLAIMILTFLVKTAVYPLTHWAIKAQAKSMWEQKKIAPELKKLTEKYKNDPRQRNAAMLQLYREHGVNPLGPLRGCLPVLMQTPIFIGLYVLFDQAVELRGQSFLWIHDLSMPDHLIDWGVSIPLIGSHFNILPILMGATQWLSMKIMHQPNAMADEMQQQIQKNMMTIMPIMFTIMLYSMPSGLMLYWVVSNVWSIGQSYITKKVVQKHQDEMDAKTAAGAKAVRVSVR